MSDINYIENKRSEIVISKNNGEISNFNYRIFWIYDRLIVQTSDDIKFFQDSSYFVLYKSALKVWSENKLFGVGLKNFRLSCKEIKLDSNNKNYPQCSTHPHNFILEILSEIGIIGLLLFLTFVYSLIIKIYFFMKINSTNSYLPKILIIILIAIMFPLIPTGSFFSTFNSSFFGIFYQFYFTQLVYMKRKKIENILITGGAGYIGSHVAKQLEKNYKIYIIDNLSNGYKKLIIKNSKFLKGDIRDFNLVFNFLKKNNIDAVIHCAGLLNVEESMKRKLVHSKQC